MPTPGAPDDTLYEDRTPVEDSLPVQLRTAAGAAGSDELLPAGTYDVVIGGRRVRATVRHEYEYSLTYADGTRVYRSTGTSRESAEAAAASPVNWALPGQPGTIAARVVVEITGPWIGHPHEPGPGDRVKGGHRD